LIRRIDDLAEKGVKMNKKRTLVIVLLLTMLFPAVVGISKAQAAYPSFTISEVKKDESVTILTQDMPKNREGKGRRGEDTTRGEKGREGEKGKEGAGGQREEKGERKEEIKGRARRERSRERRKGGEY
jgi:hypothetical protein